MTRLFPCLTSSRWLGLHDVEGNYLCHSPPEADMVFGFRAQPLVERGLGPAGELSEVVLLAQGPVEHCYR